MPPQNPTPTATPPPAQPAVPPQPQVAPVPTQAPVAPVAQPTPIGTKSYANLAIASLIIGAVSIPAGLLVFFDLIFIILGITFGLISLKSSKKGLAIAGIILSVIGLFSATFFTYFGIKHKDDANKSSSNSTSNSTNSTTSKADLIETDCFSFAKPAGTASKDVVNKTACTVDYETADAIYIVETREQITAEQADLSRLVVLVNAEFKKQLGEGTAFGTPVSTTFKDKEAYSSTVKSVADNTDGINYVVKTEDPNHPGQYRVYIIGLVEHGKLTKLDDLKNNWQWK